MEALNPFPPENFHSYDIKNQNLTEYHSTKHGLNDSVFLNSHLENSVHKSTIQDDSFNFNVGQQEEPEVDSTLRQSPQQNSIRKPAVEESLCLANKEVSTSEKENLKLQREISQIFHLQKCIPSLRENFTVHRKIGEGTFSSVFLATVNGSEGAQQRYAVKHLVPTCHPSRIEKELRCLMDIGGQDNVVGVDLCLRNGLNVAFVMPFLPHSRFSDYMALMDVNETRLYMHNLLVALRRVHSFGVIHRDVKPSNFLYDREGKRFLLVDFGLAHDVGDLYNGTSKELSTSVFVSPKKRKRSEGQPDDENSMNRKMPCKSSVHGSPRRPLQPIGKALGQGQNTQNQNVLASPTRRPLGNYQGSNVTFNHNPPANPSKRMPVPIPAGEFRMLEPKQKSAGGLVIRVQNSKVLATPVSSPATIARNGPHRRPLFTPDPPKCLVSTLSPLPPPSTPSLPPPSSQLSSVTTAPLTPSVPKSCSCHAMARVCRYCLIQRPYFAPRAGTPGFRPPEVLLKSHHQTTAVDMWAAGVILLCIASGCYPFFRSPDDITALAEIMTVFGTTRLENVASKLGRRIICSNRRPAMDLRALSERLRSRGDSSVKEPLPNDAYDLLIKLLDLDPNTRITAEEALQHPFFKCGS